MRRLGASNHAAWRVERARAVAARLGVEPWTAIQLRYSYVQPRPGGQLPGNGHMHAPFLRRRRAELLDRQRRTEAALRVLDEKIAHYGAD